MKYMLLLYGDEALDANMTEADRAAQYAEYNTFTTEVRNRGIYAGGEALHLIKDAKTVRVRSGKTLTSDGPFAETKEQLGGFYILDCKDLDEAIEMAAKIPAARDGSVEIRPLVVFE
jgi:hypothetical protein